MRTLLLLLTLSWAPALAQDTPLAPDGYRGLGAETPLDELQRLLLANDDEDAEFLGELYALEGEIRVQLSKLREVYRERRWFRLLGRRNEGALDELHQRYEETVGNPKAVLTGPDAEARAFAEMLADTRFNVRLEILRDFESTARDLRAGIAVLRATTDGFVVLNEEEGVSILRRVDVAAARLRALRQDLLALRPTSMGAKAASVDPERLKELRAIPEMPQKALRETSMDRWVESRVRQQKQMLAALFSTRLAPKVADHLAWRAEMMRQKEPLRVEALRYLPDEPEGRAAPADVQQLSKSERMRHAQFAGLRGLAFDPLDEDLTWTVAMGVDFLWGVIESRPYFDRYLALRGIRSHDHRSMEDRTLTEREEQALFVIQNKAIAAPGGR